MAEAPWRQAAVPPPPPGATGHIVPSRLKSEISDRREPPPCVQNAMLTKDKKPFTYTPGGIDLSEIRSPRMARRLERNAMNEGVSSVPQTTHHPAGQLPPSALAAMQPQLSVQVFPTGGIPQPPQGGPPPPPPPPKAPPMKTSPLPTDCYNRPDMTKIIPDNPMSMLRKTSGPVVKQDPILSKAGGVVNNVQKMDSPPRTDIFNQSVDTQPRYVEPPNQNKPTAGVGSIYVPPINQKPADSPPAVYSPPAYYKRQVSSPPQEPPKPQTPDTPNSPKPTLSKAPTPWLTQRRQNSQDVPDWAINDHRVQSPPVAQEQAMLQPREEPQQTKPVRPWQQQEKPRFTQQPEIQQRYQEPDMQPRYQQEMQPRYQQQQQEKPRFIQQQPEIQQRYQEPDVRYQQEMQPRYQQQQQQPQPRYQVDGQQRYQQQPTAVVGGARKQIQNRERPQEYYPPERTEVVIVNDPPQIYHHPGQKVVARQSPQNSYQHYKQDDGIRIIPVQIEGRSNGQMRSPTQGANRVLQKITQTDGADDDDQVVIEHSPKMYQQFPQRQTSTDGRKWNQNESDQALMGTFKQVQQQPHANNASGPKVRTIPIQIEGNGQTKNYVPPSEQTVQEPKKYMGSSIPSRSFKILQAMTAPDECGPGQSDL